MPAISDTGDDPITYTDLDLDSKVNAIDRGEEGGGEGIVPMEEEEDDDFHLHPDELNKFRTIMWNRFMEQSTVIVNATNDDQKVLRCFEQFVTSFMEPDLGGVGKGACPVKFDGVSCWPQTPPGTLRIIPCFEVFNGVYYDPSGEYRAR
ncbi:Diuretic hormone receptor [Portunus trituberculatus]|uniref:Diuretic hormone receptor n=1 Tax=Portunus trituberculatus TaxID=210409 RepID=A0A5B7IFT0_PORTR|nr:Diuretic hormone receptor [Portunus trituberculatus]